MDITVTRGNIKLSQLTAAHRQEVRRIAEVDRPEACWALDPEECRYLTIVRQTPTGLAIVDGFHRLAGMLVFGAEQVPVIVVDAPDALLATIDCDSEIGSHEVLDAIYAAAA
jgi:hypothetical protein